MISYKSKASHHQQLQERSIAICFIMVLFCVVSVLPAHAEDTLSERDEEIRTLMRVVKKLSQRTQSLEKELKQLQRERLPVTEIQDMQSVSHSKTMNMAVQLEQNGLPLMC